MGALSTNLPLCADRNKAWDSASAKESVAKYASSDGSGDKDTISWSKYAKAFLWAADSPSNFGDFKLPIADVENGELEAVWRAVHSAAGVIQGAMGGADIPDGDVPAIKRALEHYYEKAAKQFDDDMIMVPWKRTLDDALVAFEKRYGELGGVERREFEIEVRTDDTGDANSAFVVKGYSSVFNKRSLDLGGFEEIISPGAFDDVLARNPDVLLLWDHDTRYPLARTTNGTLDIHTPDEIGLPYYARVAKTSYAADLRVLLDRRDIKGASFAFTIAPDGQRWEITGPDGDEKITRYIDKIDGLYDCTITARGAYPTATSELVRTHVRSYAQQFITRTLNPDVSVESEETGAGIEQEVVAGAAEIEPKVAGRRAIAAARARARARS